MPTILDLATDVGLQINTDDYENFVDDVSQLLKYGSSNEIDQKWIVSLCHTSELSIAQEIIDVCRKRNHRSPKWWQKYNDRVHTQSPNKRRSRENRKSSEDYSDLPKGRQLQEKRRRREESPQYKDKRPMQLRFESRHSRSRKDRSRELPCKSEVPEWPGRSQSLRSPRRSRSPPQSRRRKRRRR